MIQRSLLIGGRACEETPCRLEQEDRPQGADLEHSGWQADELAARQIARACCSAARSRSACWALIFSMRSSSSWRTSETTMWRQTTIAKRQMITLATIPAASARQTASKASW